MGKEEFARILGFMWTAEFFPVEITRSVAAEGVADEVLAVLPEDDPELAQLGVYRALARLLRCKPPPHPALEAYYIHYIQCQTLRYLGMNPEVCEGVNEEVADLVARIAELLKGYNLAAAVLALWDTLVMLSSNAYEQLRAARDPSLN